MRILELIQNKETLKERYYYEERFNMVRDGKGRDSNRFDRCAQPDRKLSAESGNRELTAMKPRM
ncbi:hypothetical protein PHABIO_240 [Pseudomonas phage Phabio]|uniref:Uncharacterized protein n=1 Tax=Pseudomonas phage Phabio TaxID=2006668 RepID=A0A1Y0STQ2_9CAUD|nr:hypothetical protein MZD05_gp240 [Pseudomonas phage Phabio]ARV76871.1 hypothetical protein PHABIO_240 [Pseudomonas phage Phabio]